ncbi:hypothetical protein ACNJ7E_14770 [Rhodococcus sp. NM-2]|uniref:hypothetical protein n=1 Tax=Rhodococcus sp. NM-2 TaxID=3401174 RepID=UPI003AAE018C
MPINNFQNGSKPDETDTRAPADTPAPGTPPARRRHPHITNRGHGITPGHNTITANAQQHVRRVIRANKIDRDRRRPRQIQEGQTPARSDITDTGKSVTRRQVWIDAAAALDGIYVLRTSVPAGELDLAGVITASMNLAPSNASAESRPTT